MWKHTVMQGCLQLRKLWYNGSAVSLDLCGSYEALRRTKRKVVLPVLLSIGVDLRLWIPEDYNPCGFSVVSRWKRLVCGSRSAGTKTGPHRFTLEANAFN